MTWTIAAEGDLNAVVSALTARKNALGDRHTILSTDHSDEADAQRLVVAAERRAVEVLTDHVFAQRREYPNDAVTTMHFIVSASGHKRLVRLSVSIENRS